MDLDNLLDDVDMSALESKPVAKSVKKDSKDKAVAVTSSSKPAEAAAAADGLITSEVRPWLAASANVPKETRERWTRMVKTDSDAELVSKFQRSTAYSEWDASNSKRGVNKCLQDLVRSSINKSDLTEAQMSKVMTLVNPVTDSEHGKQLTEAFTRQIIKDFRVDLISDPNYNPAQFPNLAKALLVEKS